MRGTDIRKGRSPGRVAQLRTSVRRLSLCASRAVPILVRHFCESDRSAVPGCLLATRRWTAPFLVRFYRSTSCQPLWPAP